MKFKARKDTPVEREVNGSILRFYTIRVSWFFSGQIKELAQAISAFLIAYRRPEPIPEQIQTGDKDGNFTQRTAPVTAQDIEEHNKITRDLFNAALEKALSKETWEMLCRAFVDSLRDLYPNPTEADVQEMQREMDLPTAQEMLAGFLSANAGQVSSWMKTILAQVFARSDAMSDAIRMATASATTGEN